MAEWDWRLRTKRKLDLIAIGFQFPKNHLFLIDHYCEEFHLNRTDFIKSALYHYMQNLGIFKYEPPAIQERRNNRLDKFIGNYHEEREIDSGSWVTDSGDFGEPDPDPNEYTSDTPPEEEAGL